MTIMSIYFFSFFWKKDLSSKSMLTKILATVFFEVTGYYFSTRIMDSKKFGRPYSLVILLLLASVTSSFGLLFVALGL